MAVKKVSRFNAASGLVIGIW